MTERNRQLALLAVLIVVFGGLVAGQLWSGSGAGSGGAPRRAPGAASTGVGGPEIEVGELRVEALQHKPATYKPGRDPFRFAPKPQAAPPPKPRPARRREPPKPRQRQPERQQPARPQPPAVEFKYLGSFGLPGREIAVFSDGQEILNAFAGDVLQQEFVVRSIGYESADIGFVNFPDEPAKRLAVGG